MADDDFSFEPDQGDDQLGEERGEPTGDQAQEQSPDLETLTPEAIQKLPPEVQKLVRSLQGDYTRKTQSLAEQRRLTEQAQRLQQALIAQGITPSRIAEAIEALESDPGALNAMSQAGQAAANAGQAGTGDIELDRVLADDPQIRRIIARHERARQLGDEERMEDQVEKYENRVDVLREKLEVRREGLKAEMKALSADGRFRGLLESEVAQSALKAHWSAGGFKSLTDAAKSLFFDDLLKKSEDGGFDRGRNTQKRVESSPQVGKTVGSGGAPPTEIPKEVLLKGAFAIDQYMREHGMYSSET